YASYQWSTGDTTYYTFVDQEGEYSVLINTAEGCQNLESVVMNDTYVDIKVPNAFTPNSDGLNDTFKPLVNLERIKHYHLAIYNKWGQLLFESNDPLKGWDGQNPGNGVYTWVIDYENRVGKAGQMKGTVAVVK
ncbi:MAG TPA: gliding motility-associated C-terminal domain-containing protein, partial [Lentimicrobium sp.]|nr:gliding motility-associated C-terminal domain-containing protein [Lentimicrobium sp.]